MAIKVFYICGELIYGNFIYLFFVCTSISLRHFGCRQTHLWWEQWRCGRIQWRGRVWAGRDAYVRRGRGRFGADVAMRPIVVVD